jgi:diguanylate cyclase (GGDEF)-like protein/PAS domain S-box-containing protein
MLLIAAVMVGLFQNAGNTLSHLDISSVLDPAEDYVSLLSPMLWGFFFYAFLQDVIYRELHESEERNRILLASLPQRIFFKNPDSVFVSVNEPFARDLSLEPGQLAGRTDWDFFPPELAEKYRADDKRVMATGKPETLVERNVAGGVERTVEVVKAPVVNDNGKVIGLFGIFTDITERKRAEEEQRERERFLTSIFASIQDGLSILDADLRIVRANPTMENWYAHNMPLAGRKCYEVYQGRAERCEVCPGRKTLDTGEAAFAVAPKRGPGGEIAGWLDLYTFPLIDTATGQLKGVIEYVRDITARKQAEDALRYRFELERLITTISSSFINLAHSQIDHGINCALQTVGEFAGVDRAYVFQLSEDGRIADNTHEWCAEGIEPQMRNLKGIVFDEELPWVSKRLRNQQVIHVPRVAVLPAEAQLERKHFEKQGVQSLIAVPVVSSGRLAGFVGFDSVRTEKAWDDDTVVILKIMGVVFSNALERKRADESRRASEERYRLIFENARDMISLLSLNGLRYLYVNPAALATLGYSQEELIGRSALQFVHADDAEAVETRLREATSQGQGAAEFRCKRKDGSYIWLEVTGRVTPDGKGQAVVLVISRDITERMQRQEELRALSWEDSLTRVNNRRGFAHLAEQQLKVANRTGSTMLLFFADVDQMKWINDNLGHKTGDLALIETANVLKEAFRESDIIGRVGGDEFAVLAIQARSNEADEILARLQRRLDARNAQRERRYRLSLSVGIASYDPQSPLPLEELMARSDALMYERKRGKRDS